MEVIKNEIYKAEITGYTSDGDGVCRINGMVVFVPNSVVGDVAQIKVIKVLKNIAFGRIDTLETPSINRISPECEYSYKCGGCALHNMNYKEELRFKEEKVLEALKRIAGLNISPLGTYGSDKTSRYRNKAQFPIASKNGRAITGFYRKNSHDIVEIDDCLIQTQDSVKIATAICNWIDSNLVRVYNEKTKTGMIRHVYVRTGEKSGEILVTIVATKAKLFFVDELISAITSVCDKVTGIILNVNSNKGNVILGKKNIRLWGSEFLQDTMCDNEFMLSPMSFYQVNHAMAEKLYESVIEFANLDKNKTVLDLFCGAGTISLAMAKYAGLVIGVDIVPEAIENAKSNAIINNCENVRFVCCDSIDAMSAINADTFDENGEVVKCKNKIENIDVLVVDPPRKGLENITEIIEIAAKNIVYVSCDPASLARDIKILGENGYKVVKLKIFDLFPRTQHVESVVLIEKTNI